MSLLRSFGSSIVLQLYNHHKYHHTACEYMFDFASNLIKVCCFEVTEGFRMLIQRFSYLLILPFRAGKLWKKLLDCLIRRASVFHQHTKVRGVRRPTFTWTRLDTTPASEKSTSRATKKYRFDQL